MRYEKHCSGGCGELLRTDSEDEKEMCAKCWGKLGLRERLEILSTINRRKLAALDAL